MTAAVGKRFLASTKRDPAFISKGFTYWNEVTTKHWTSACHREAVAALALQVASARGTGDIGEMLNAEHEREKAQNRALFRRILQNLCFLAHQSLASRGEGEDSNFAQLLHLRAFDCPEVTSWMDRKSNKYTSGDMQNECK